jgi:hypothetical protein
VSPPPTCLVPDLAGGVWAVDAFGDVTRIDATGAHVATAASGIGGNAFTAGVTVRDGAGNEELVVAGPTSGALAFDGAANLLWSHPGDTADALGVDGTEAVIRVAWHAGENVVRAIWMDAAGAELARASYSVSVPAGATVRVLATGTNGGALIAGQIDFSDPTGASSPYSLHFLLNAQSSDHSLTALPWKD